MSKIAVVYHPAIGDVDEMAEAVVKGAKDAGALALSNVFYHWDCLIVPPGYTRAVVAAAGDNPYGGSHPAGAGDDVSAEALTAARYQGYRLARYAARLAAASGGQARRRGGTSPDPLAVDPYDPHHPSRFAWQARVASP